MGVAVGGCHVNSWPNRHNNTYAPPWADQSKQLRSRADNWQVIKMQKGSKRVKGRGRWRWRQLSWVCEINWRNDKKHLTWQSIVFCPSYTGIFKQVSVPSALASVQCPVEISSLDSQDNRKSWCGAAFNEPCFVLVQCLVPHAYGVVPSLATTSNTLSS